jgi:hypothetical protein
MAVVMVDGVDSGRHLMIFNFLLDLVAASVAAFAVDRRWGEKHHGGPSKSDAAS